VTNNEQSALLAGVLTSTGSWPNILPNGERSPWSVRTSWYCGIILSLFSILSAADQTVRLHRLSSHRDGLKNIRKLLAKNCEAKTGQDMATARGVSDDCDAVHDCGHVLACLVGYDAFAET
jgi:hypothetical protein